MKTFTKDQNVLVQVKGYKGLFQGYITNIRSDNTYDIFLLLPSRVIVPKQFQYAVNVKDIFKIEVLPEPEIVIEP